MPQDGFIPTGDLKTLLVYRYLNDQWSPSGRRKLLVRLMPQLTVQQVLSRLKRDGVYRLEWRNSEGRQAVVMNFAVRDGVAHKPKIKPKNIPVPTSGTLLDLERASELDLENDE